MKITLAIDPGPVKSGFVVYNYDEALPADGTILAYGHVENEEIVAMLESQPGPYTDLVTEMVGHYGSGMPVGKDVFHTCLWIGRYIQTNLTRHPYRPLSYCQTKDCRLALCGNMRAKKPHVRQAMVDILGDKGTKKNPGKTFGMSDHTWSALAVALTHAMGHSRAQLD